MTPAVTSSSTQAIAVAGTAYNHGIAARKNGSSTVIAQRMNGSPVPCAWPPAAVAIPLMSGMEMTIAIAPTTPLAIAFARSSRNSSAVARSRASCSSNAVWSGEASCAPYPVSRIASTRRSAETAAGS